MAISVTIESLLGGAVLETTLFYLPGARTPTKVLVPASGCQGLVKDQGGSQVPVFADRTLAGVPLAQPLVADADGRLPGWVAQPNALSVTVSAPSMNTRTIQVGQDRDPVNITDTHVVASEAEMLAIPGAHEGTVAIRSDEALQAYINNGGGTGLIADWQAIGSGAQGAVDSVNGQAGVVVLTAAEVGAYPDTATLDAILAPVAAVAMGGQRITGLADPVAATDAVTLQAGDARYAPIGGGGVVLPVGSAQNRVLAWDAITDEWVDDVGVYSPRNDRGIVVVNQCVDPRATTAANFAGTATGAGTVDQAPTPVADGYQQTAAPMSCQEVKATPDAAGGGTVGFTTRWKANGHPIILVWGQLVAVRRAVKLSGVLGGAWYAELVVKYFDATDTLLSEVVVWSDVPALDQWFVPEGFDGQAPAGVNYVETELRVVGSTPGDQVTIRCTELVNAIDPDGDVPGYVGGDNRYGSWYGAANASVSQTIFDPLTAYPSKPFGTSSAQPWSVVADDAQIRASAREVGMDVIRASTGFWTGGAAGPPVVPPVVDPNAIASAVAYIREGFGVTLGPGNPPAWMCSNGDASGTTIPDLHLDVYASTFIGAIQEIEAETGIPAAEWLVAVEVWNEPNLVQFNKWIATLSNAAAAAKYVAQLNAIYDAVKAAYPTVPVAGIVLSSNFSGSVAGQRIDPVEFYNDVVAGGGEFDYLCLHPYPGGPSSGPAAAGWSPINSGLTTGWDNGLKRMKDAQRAGADNRPIFVTECGQVAGQSVAGTLPPGQPQPGERAQQQAVSLLYGRMLRDPSIVGIFLFNVFSRLTTALDGSGDYGFVDAQSHRRRGVAHQIAKMRGMPPLAPSYSEVLRVGGSLIGRQASAPGSIAASDNTVNRVVIGLNSPSILLGGLASVPGNPPTATINRVAAGAGSIVTVNRGVDSAGIVRATGTDTSAATVTTGAGTELAYDTGLGQGYLQAYDRAASGYRPLLILASALNIASIGAPSLIVGSSLYPTVVTAIVKAVPGQTADLWQWADSSGAVLSRITSTGALHSGSIVRVEGVAGVPVTGAGLELYYSAALGVVQTYDRGGAGYQSLTLKGSAINLAPQGSGVLVTGLGTSPTLVVKDAVGQTADLLQIQNSSGTVLSRITAAGTLDSTTVMRVTGSTGPPTSGQGMEFWYGSGNGQIVGYNRDTSSYAGLVLTGSSINFAPMVTSVAIVPSSGNTTSPTLIVKASPVQTADITQWANSSGTVLASVTSTGKLNALSGIVIPTGAAAGSILTSDASGNGIWTTVAGLQGKTAATFAAGDATEFAFSMWKELRSGTGVIAPAAVVGIYPFAYAPTVAMTTVGGASTAAAAFYFDPADYGAGAGRAVQIRVRGSVITNATAPGSTFTLGMYPVAAFAGANAAIPTIAGLNAAVVAAPAVAAPGATSATHVEAAAVAAPAAGWYCLACAISVQAVAAGSDSIVSCELQVRQV